ncbi:entericidin A/B family lipoprotein [Pantoea sp. Bo_2]|jgi:entericidin A|uniref:Entericidin A/B family lipoprotein n=7 Tax=Pantoea TaxID=53335 RepID=A0AAN1NNJ9_9GAMM|nr:MULTISPECIES: entericidin A/B family lipoprotein [Pantoea]MDF9908957.1 entericidin A [Pantoea brenneri]PQL27977.1 entericidin, EcnA/B family [Pantoea ananatis]QXG54310.1 entericidin A/B family lipoprotein [Pantoea jilinensis]AVE16825.1 entericidin, EcnA/B family [Pantoea vagans]AVV36434.1 entericidin, EcnA/B family [Pantoea vagans]
MIKLAKLIAFALLVSSALSACNTFHGFGEDVSHLGGAISRAAK